MLSITTFSPPVVSLSRILRRAPTTSFTRSGCTSSTPSSTRSRPSSTSTLSYRPSSSSRRRLPRSAARTTPSRSRRCTAARRCSRTTAPSSVSPSRCAVMLSTQQRVGGRSEGAGGDNRALILFLARGNLSGWCVCVWPRGAVAGHGSPGRQTETARYVNVWSQCALKQPDRYTCALTPSRTGTRFSLSHISSLWTRQIHHTSRIKYHHSRSHQTVPPSTTGRTRDPGNAGRSPTPTPPPAG